MSIGGFSKNSFSKTRNQNGGGLNRCMVRKVKTVRINHYLSENDRNLVVTHLKNGKDSMGLWSIEKKLKNRIVGG